MECHSPFSPLPLEGAVERSEAGLDARLLKYGFPRVVIPKNNTCVLPLSTFARPLSVCKSEISFPPETLAILLSRGAEKIIPNGDTRLSAGDTLVLSALSVAPVTGLALSEIHVTKKSRYYQKSLSSLHLPNGHLVVLILRQGEVIIPKGDTVLEAGDVMVMNGKNE